LLERDSGVVGAVCGEEPFEVVNMALEDGEELRMPRGVRRASWVEEGVCVIQNKVGQLFLRETSPFPEKRVIWELLKR
jgi:hypothetical protein